MKYLTTPSYYDTADDKAAVIFASKIQIKFTIIRFKYIQLLDKFFFINFYIMLFFMSSQAPTAFD